MRIHQPLNDPTSKIYPQSKALKNIHFHYEVQEQTTGQYNFYSFHNWGKME